METKKQTGIVAKVKHILGVGVSEFFTIYLAGTKLLSYYYFSISQ